MTSKGSNEFWKIWGNAHELNHPHKHPCRWLSQEVPDNKVSTPPPPGVVVPGGVPSVIQALQNPVSDGTNGIPPPFGGLNGL